MRAFEIALFVACVVAASVFLPNLVGDSFGGSYFPSGYSLISGYNIDALSNFPANPSPVDYFFLMITIIINSIVWSMQVLLTFVTLAPWLMTNFGFPWWLAIPIQVGSWYLFVIAIVQIWRAVSIDIMR